MDQVFDTLRATKAGVRAIALFGPKRQFGKVQEELAELLLAQARLDDGRGTLDEWLGEVVDVVVVTLGLANVVAPQRLRQLFEEKFVRFERRLGVWEDERLDLLVEDAAEEGGMCGN